MRLLITGATGFIGKNLVAELLERNFNISIAVRQKTKLFPDNVKQFEVRDFGGHPDFSTSLVKIDCVIHLAGMAHILTKNNDMLWNEYNNTNTKLTLNLAKQAVTAKVKRFIFLSSIAVNGNQSNQPFVETDSPNPKGLYAKSKYEAEQQLLKLAKKSSLDVVIIRPPLVYGNNTPGNFGRLIKWASSNIILPLPLGAVNNTRSFIAIDNLVSFIIVCTFHPKSSNEIFLIADNDPLSTKELLNKIAKAFRKKALLFPVPVKWMYFVAKILGNETDAIRLFSSLTIDNGKARELLDWQPITTMDEQLGKIVENEKSI